MIVSIIVTYNGMEWYDKCFGSLQNSTIPNEIVVIDNGSSDNSLQYIKTNYPEVHLIESKENLGFAKANNLGIKYALDRGADFVFLLNQDAWVHKDTLNILLKAIKILPDAGIVTPVHLNGSHTSLDIGFAHYISHYNTPGFVSDLYFGKPNLWYKTDFVNAAAWLIRRECIEKVGGFDTSLFFHYGEDDNYCKRVIFHNFSIYIITTTTICHDREIRNGTRPEIYEKEILTVSRIAYYSDLKLDDNLIDKELDSLKKSYKRKVLKYVLMLKFNEIKKLKEFTQNELQLFTKIKISREANKKGNMTWLSEMSNDTI